VLEGEGKVFRRGWLALIVAVLLAGASPLAAETLDRVLAVAGGQVIMMSDVTAALDLGFVADDSPGGDRIGAVLSKLISRALVLAEANRYSPPEPTDDAVARELASVRARFPSAAAFDAALQRSGLTEDQLRVTLRENLRIKTYIAQRFTVAEDEAHRLMMIDEWVAGLRQRADVVNLYQK
jgi:hypothetical protein